MKTLQLFLKKKWVINNFLLRKENPFHKKGVSTKYKQSEELRIYSVIIRDYTSAFIVRWYRLAI